MTLAVYTTIYPGVEGYLADWYRSLRQQTDQDFQLWIGLDMLGSESVQNMLGSRPERELGCGSSRSHHRTDQAAGPGPDCGNLLRGGAGGQR